MVTTAGAIIVPLGLVLFLTRPEALLPLAVFFVPFTATTLIDSEAVARLSPAHFLALLWMASHWTPALVGGRVRLKRGGRWPMFGLLVFALSAIASLVTPLFVAGGSTIGYGPDWDEVVKPLSVTNNNLINVGWIVFGATVTASLISWAWTQARVLLVLRTILASGLFVSAWGVLQWFLQSAGLPYPAFLFNNSSRPAAQGYQQIFEDLSISRVSSVAAEPSILAHALLSIIPFALFAVMSGKTILSKRADLVTLFACIGALILSTSSTGYVGMGFLALSCLYLLVYLRHWRVVHGVFALLMVGLIAFVVIMSPALEALRREILFEKLASGSGIERLISIPIALSYFREYPIFGVGWGTLPTHDLIANILGNSGLVGFVSFCIMVGTFLIRPLREIRSARLAGRGIDHESLPITCAAVLSLVTLLFSFVITSFPHYYLYFWLVLGLSCCSVLRTAEPSV